MTALIVTQLGIFALFLPVAWSLPPRVSEFLLCLLTAAFIAAVSWPSLVWLAVTSVAVPALMVAGDASGRRGMFTAASSASLVILLLVLRDLPIAVWIGLSYFTLRHVHVLMDWWMGVLPRPSLGSYLRYQFFLPVLMAGPIHRFQNFEQQIAFRRWMPAQAFEGAERILIGMFQVVAIGEWIMHRARLGLEKDILSWPSFAYEWAMSGLYWVDLFFTFSGLSSIAIGMAMLWGVKIEENFNKPWRATNLIDFWTRWHMTLSLWCRDYVFRPFTAMSRRPAVGAILAMIAIGLWHGATPYWVTWGIWQGLGLILTRVVQSTGLLPENSRATRVVGFSFVAVWLTLARPLSVTLLGLNPG